MQVAWEDARVAFGDAAAFFVRTARQAGDRWEQPGLGEWDVRALVGHTSRALLTVEQYLGRPAQSVEVESAADYFRAVRGKASDEAVAQRGREAGEQLGADPAVEVAEIAERVNRLLDGCDGTELVTTIAGGMRLADYLPTRTFELTVHTCDLAVALGEPIDVPPTAAAQALAIVVELAADDPERAGLLLLRATGRSVAGGLSVL